MKMPPKKKKTSAIVVGTVSTRSTRRESIVNIEIIPKANKTSKTSTRKSVRNTFNTLDIKTNVEEKKIDKKTSPEILEILKDWSDEETGDDKIICGTSEKCKSPQSPALDSSGILTGDQQSLIDILEGNQSEIAASVSLHNSGARSVIINEEIISMNSPCEVEVIEECIVEDDSIILELSEDQIKSVNKHSPCTTENLEKDDGESDQIENKIEYIYTDSSNLNTSEDNCCTFSIHMTDDENKSITSEDCSQNLVLLKDDISDNDINISWKEASNFSQEQVKHDISNNSITQESSNALEDSIKEMVIEESFTAKPKELRSNNLAEKGNGASDNTVALSKTNNGKGSSESDAAKFEEKSTENIATTTVTTISKESIECESIENILCEKVSETMVISKDSANDDESDFISDKLGLTMQKMHIDDNADIKAHINNDNEQFSLQNQSESEDKKESALSSPDSIKTPTKTKAQRKSFDSDIKPTRKSTRNKNVSPAASNVKKPPLSKPVEIKTENGSVNDIIKKTTVAALTECDIIQKGFEEAQNKRNKMTKQKARRTTNKIQEADFKPDCSELEQTHEEPKSTEKAKGKKLLKNVDVEESDENNSLTNFVKSEPPTSMDYSNEDQKQTRPQKIKKNTKRPPVQKELKSKQFKESKKKNNKPKKDQKLENSEEVRRSDRIKTIIPVKKRSHGLVRSKSESSLLFDAESSDTNSVQSEVDKCTPTASPQPNKKDRSKSRWKSVENVSRSSSNSPQSETYPQIPKADGVKTDKSGQAEIEARLKTFHHLKENQYKTDRQICKEAQDMVCDCYLAEEDIQKNEFGCGEDCLNRLLLIECGLLCQVEGRCTNKRFQKGQFAPVEVFKTEKKGLGLRAAANIAYGEFILEYVGEVLDPNGFDKRAEVYAKDKNIHFYFMSLRADAIIDATMKGNISRFINHSCDPNAETQKWTVNGELRIGFFSTRTILAGEEITFDYRFQRYGKEAQKCYCEAATCRGWLGERPDESEDEEEEEEEEDISKQSTVEVQKLIPVVSNEIESDIQAAAEKSTEPDITTDISADVKKIDTSGVPQELPKKIVKKKPRKEILYEDFDQLNEDIEMLVTTGLKNQAHTLKLSRLMVRAKDLDQRKKLLRVLRRGELPCRRLFLDYHGLRLMHGYMIDAQQPAPDELCLSQTKLELLQTLAVLPIQNKTMLIESKVLPAVEKWSTNEDLIEENLNEKAPKEKPSKLRDDTDPAVKEKIEEIKFLASKLLEEWSNLKEVFRIPKKQRIEQMKEHEKEANRKFMASNYAQEQESSRKSEQRYRTWSRYKSERETNKKGAKPEDKDKPSAAYLKISKHERRKLFALQMELKEEERRLKQREMWRQHEMNCMMIGADPRFTAPFDPNKGFQYIWNPSIGQWQALPVPPVQNQTVYSSPIPTTQGVGGFNVPPAHKPPNFITAYPPPTISVPGLPVTNQQFPAIQTNIPPPMVPGLPGSVPGLPGSVPGLTSAVQGIAGSVPGITQPPLPSLPMFQEVKQEEDPSQVKFAGPIPPPAKLPPKWKCAKDKYGRPFYYHVKLRKSQWEPPPLPEVVEESSEISSSDTSTLSSSDSSSDSDTDDEIDDTKLLMEVRRQMDKTPKLKSIIPERLKQESKGSNTPSPDVKTESDEGTPEERKKDADEDNFEQLSSIDLRLKEQFNLDDSDPPKKKRRIGLCEEIIISPRTEEDRQQFKEDMKRYKATKEKLKRQKEQMQHLSKKKAKPNINEEEVKRLKEKRHTKTTVKSRIKEMNDWNNEHAKKIKEVFRSNMATTVVSVLNAYRKPDCKEGRITNTEDFKHLARKLTHFVMLKEMKHIEKIEDLECTDNVKAKAREYIRKYMSKFGELYQKRQDEPDFKD